ncbi:hypothetical protein [Roseimaritima sediminicola]|nr:hypothetical protein [Roseimaritima sediminicola]
MSPKQFAVRVERQDHPTQSPYWQTFMLDYEPGLNITSVHVIKKFFDG